MSVYTTNSNRLPDGSTANAAGDGPSDEQARLEEAMRKADEILVSSLRQDDRRRRQRRLWMIGLLSGGVVMIASVLLVMLMGAEPPAPPPDAQIEKAGQLNTEGWALWKQRDMGGAEAKFAEAVKVDPTFSTAWNGLGWARFNAGKWKEAEEAFLKAIETDETNAAALNGLGQVYYAQGKLDKAEEYLKKAAPNAPAAWWGLARIALMKSDWAEAQKWSQKIVDSGDASAQNLLDAARAQKLDPQLRKEIAPPDKAPDQPNAEVARAWKLWQQGRPAQAKVLFEKYLKDHPDDANAVNGLGWCLLNMGKPAEAKVQFEKALSLDKNQAGAMNGLALTLKAEGKTDEAIKTWEAMLKQFPGVNAGTYGLADAYFEKKQFAKAAELYEQIANQNPADAQIRQKLDLAKSQASKAG